MADEDIQPSKTVWTKALDRGVDNDVAKEIATDYAREKAAEADKEAAQNSYKAQWENWKKERFGWLLKWLSGITLIVGGAITAYLTGIFENLIK